MGSDFGGVGWIDGDGLALDFDGVAFDAMGDAAIGFGRQAGESGESEVSGAELGELLDEAVGGSAAEAEVTVAELFPGEPEGFVHAVLFELLEALGLVFGTFVGDHGERLLPADPRFAGWVWGYVFHR